MERSEHLLEDEKKAYIKKDKKIIRFDETKIGECQFHQYKRPISINEVDINKIVISKVFPFGKQDFRYLIG